eukprot:scaffold649_cov347-Pavlova_lutheri.AAC.50
MDLPMPVSPCRSGLGGVPRPLPLFKCLCPSPIARVGLSLSLPVRLPAGVGLSPSSSVSVDVVGCLGGLRVGRQRKWTWTGLGLDQADVRGKAGTKANA